MQEVAVLVDVGAANLGPSVQDAIEKAVNARMSVCRDAAKCLWAEVKVNILMSDTFSSRGLFEQLRK